jgi:uncharacterized protein (TIGR03437 family)
LNFHKFSILTTAFAVLSAIPAQAAVKLTAMQIISVDTAGKIPGVGGHRFKTTLHGGQPCLFLVDGDNLDGAIINGPDAAHNGLDLTLSAGTHTYTIYAERYNTFTWTNYSIHFYFDLANAPQISAMAPLNVTSTQFSPPFQTYSEFTEDLGGHPVKTLNTLLYKSGQTEVRLTGFQFATPTLYNKDRVGPFESKSDKTMDYVGQFTLEVKAPPAIAPGGAVNAASFTAKVAPGSLFSIFGTDLATATDSAKSLPLATSLSGTSVTVGGKPAPLVFVSGGQVNAQVPYEVTEGDNVPVIVTANGLSSLAATVSVVPASPGIFQFGNKHAVMQNEDYTVNNTDNPAKAGSYVVLYLTGAGQVDNAVATGKAAGSDPLSRPRASVSVTVGSQTADIAFAGLAPGFVGLTQINLKIPNLAPGDYPLVVSVNGEKSNAATVSVK